jgi:hypothetical protein
MTMERLQELFKAAFLECTLDEDGDLRVVSEHGFTCFVTRDDDKKFVIFRSFFKFRDDASPLDCLDLVNKLNDQVVFTRFSTPRADLLAADYFLSYEEGIMPFQIGRSFRWFCHVIQGGISKYDTQDIVA